MAAFIAKEVTNRGRTKARKIGTLVPLFLGALASCFLWVATGCLLTPAVGCVSADRQAPVALVADDTQAGVVNVAADIASPTVGRIGGNGDSVTSWILAGGAVLGPVAWLAYPLVWRPLRNRRRQARSHN